MSHRLPAGPWQTHTHPAMNTLFTIRLKMEDAAKAAALAGQCFRQLDDLESLLSRYREDGDIAAINQLRAGESLLLHEETWACLRVALEAHAMTSGLFDPALGALTAARHAPPCSPRPELTGCLSLNPHRPEITCLEPGRQLDLGGIGKGYALDRMAETLCELGVTDSMLAAAASTHLATGASIWPMKLAGNPEPHTIALQGNSLSASGAGIQGSHIVHPLGETGAPSPLRVWVVATSAALSDALSTACFLADDAERATLLSTIPALSRILVENPGGKIAEILPSGA